MKRIGTPRPGSGLAVAAALAVLGLSALAQDGKTTYYVGHHEKFINITFESEADLETIVGTTHKASGEIQVDMAKETGSVSITVPVDSLKTGVDMRDGHLQGEMWLDAKKNPNMKFVSKKIEPVKDQKNRFTVTGDFTVHGVSKEMAVTVDWKEVPEEAAKKAKFPDGKWLKFTTEFKVKLSDFGVKVPEMAAGKVNDEWTVKMTIFAGTASLEKKK